MSGRVVSIDDDAQFNSELTSAGTKLVVVDFFATWCGPCRAISPAVADLSNRYSRAVFLKVDVDKCQETAMSLGITAMPTFYFYKSTVKVDSMRGADAANLEAKIQKWYSEEEEAGDSGVKGHMDLSSMINKAGSECLNESDEHTFDHCLTTKEGYLESDCDEQLIINLGFNQSVKLHSMKLHCSKGNGPKTIKLFINQPHTLDFDSADNMEAVQLLSLEPDDLKEGALIPLKYVKLQSVQNLTLFIKDNQNGEETTQIDYLGLIGSITSATNMADFKRVAGKKGESH